MNAFKFKKSIIAACICAASLTLGMGSTFAAPPFELDGNATSNDFPGDDWDVVNNGGGSSTAKTGLIIDRPEPAFAQFTGGGSKDEQDIPNWKHRSGTPPAKDDITNAYAAAYIDTDNNDHQILIFGIDRFDTSGDAQLGFWFLQDEVQPVAGGDFSGEHKDNDILVLVNFSGGGDVPTIEVFKWQGGAPVSLGSGTDVLCTDGWIPAGQDHCGITNAVNVAAPWAYENKDVGVTTQFPPAAFFEGAIDVTALGIDACITNFLAESRSSTSITAVLKDFATPSGGFNVCGIDVTKNCTNPRLNAAQDRIIYDISGTVIANGGTVHNVALSDNPAADGEFSLVDCTDNSIVLGSFPLTTLNGTACYTNTQTVLLSQNGLTDTVTATANTESDNSGVTLTDSATPGDPDDPNDLACPNLQISPALYVEKDCETVVEVSGGKVVAKVNVTGMVCNIGDSNLNSVVVDDLLITTSPDPLVNGINLTKPSAPGLPPEPDSCQSYSGSYYPSAALDTDGLVTTDPHAVIFKDTVRATGKDIFNVDVMPQTDMADCPLCQDDPE